MEGLEGMAPQIKQDYGRLKARQAQITQELTEITGGAEALKG